MGKPWPCPKRKQESICRTDVWCDCKEGHREQRMDITVDMIRPGCHPKDTAGETIEDAGRLGDPRAVVHKELIWSHFAEKH